MTRRTMPKASGPHFPPALLRHVAAFSALAASACTSFPSIPADQCGNRVVESGEDCDFANYVDAASGKSFRCGEANTAQACHVRCDSGSECPAGWVCDQQGLVCRQPKGTFEPVVDDLGNGSQGVALFNRVEDLSVVELDGKRGSELAIRGGDAVDTEDDLFVAYFGPDAQPRSVRREVHGLKAGSGLASAPSLVDVDPEGLARDILVVAPHPRLPSLLTLRGLADGTLLPGMAGQSGGLSASALLTPSVKDDPSGAFGFVAIFDGAKSSLAYDAFVGGPLPGYLIESPGLAELGFDLAPGESAIAKMASGRLGSGIPEWLVMAAKKPIPHFKDPITELRFVGTIAGAASSSFVFPLPPSLDVDESGGVWIADVDGDGANDLLLGAADGNTYVAYGATDDPATLLPRFSSVPGGPPDQAFSSAPFIVGSHPLALGLIDGDSIADIVFADHGIALSKGDDIGGLASVCPFIQSPASYSCGLHLGTIQNAPLPEWAEAKIVDLNHDGVVDVVVASASGSLLTVFSTDLIPVGGTVQFSERSIPTGRPPRGLETADLDGDLVQDIAFHVEHNGIDSIYVAFGRTSGGPEDPHKILDAGKILSIRAVSTGRDLDVLSEDGGAGARWSLISGRTDRQLVSPMLLPCVARVGAGLTVPQELGAGQFDARAGVDAAILHEDCLAPQNSIPKDVLTLVSGTPNGGLEPVLTQVIAPLACGTSFLGCQALLAALRPPRLELPTEGGWSSHALMLHADLAGSGRDDVILLGPQGDGSRVLVARVDDANPSRFTIVEDSPLADVVGTSQAFQGSAAVGDVDGDGAVDVVAMAPSAIGGSKLLVFLNDHMGGLDVRGAHTIDLGATPITSFALFDPIIGTHTSKILFGTKGELSIADLSVAQGALLNPSKIADRGAGHLAAADFDGDGITDFAVSTEQDCTGTSCFTSTTLSKVLIYRGLAKNR